MTYTVRVHENGEAAEFKAEAGINLLSFLRQNSYEMNTPCGGKGTCGKCKIRVNLAAEPALKEKSVLGSKALERGYRLACYNNINSDMEIFLDNTNTEANIITGAKERSVKLKPALSKQLATLGIPDINDQISDLDRIAAFYENSTVSVSLDLLRELPEALRRDDFKVTLGYLGRELVFAEAGDTSQKLFGIAVDIGTTTIAAYLYDLTSGKKIDVYSVLNPQRKFGADVLSRIDYTLSSKASSDEMNEVIIGCMNDMIQSFCSRNNIVRNDIYTVVFVGNTTMMHFLMNLPARNIATSPFIPVTTRLHRFNAGMLGININRNGYAIMFPTVSAYIGADTVAAVLSSGMYEDSRISLLIDIGTNGEIVLGNTEWLYSCSAAAGPAFEGANIRNGVGGIKGAIDKVSFSTDLKYTTIGKEKPIGICGSGIVDAIAGMLSSGVIDETGRIVFEDEAEALSEELQKRLVDVDGIRSLLLVGSEKSGTGIDIAITQRDVRELQNAKAAIAAGIKVLAKHAGISLGDIDRVYLAGGFGSYISIESALKIGLLPKELEGRIESIGNAAGAGAVEGLVSEEMLEKANVIKNRIEYIELSARADFVDEYVECMMFE